MNFIGEQLQYCNMNRIFILTYYFLPELTVVLFCFVFALQKQFEEAFMLFLS